MCGRVRQRAESAGKCPERLTERNGHGGRESLVGKKPAHLEGGYVQSEKCEKRNRSYVKDRCSSQPCDFFLRGARSEDFRLGASPSRSRRNCWKTWPVPLSIRFRRATYARPHTSDVRDPPALLSQVQGSITSAGAVDETYRLLQQFQYYAELLDVRRRRLKSCHPCHKSGVWGDAEGDLIPPLCESHFGASRCALPPGGA